MSPIIMEKFSVAYIDCANCKGKNLHLLNSIEIYFYINTSSLFVIEYNFHKIDFNLWKEVYFIHKECNENAILYDQQENMIKIENLKDTENYYKLKLVSENANLYRNINIICYLKNKNWNNMDAMIKQNLWEK